MIRLARTFILVAAIASVIGCVTPPRAAAVSPGGALCTLGGLVSGVVGKVCTVASHAGNVLSAGKKLLGGHVGGALNALTGSKAGKAVTAVAGVVAIAGMAIGGARYLLRGTASVIGSTTRPNLESSWFSASYWRMAAVSALLTLPFLFAAAIQAMIRSDLAMLVRAAFGYLPLGLLAVGIAAPVTMLLLAGSDEMSSIVASASGHADTSFLARVSVFTGLSLRTGTAFAAFFVALLAAAATMVLWIELLIRAAAIYVIVLMLPLFFAALVWPARRIWAMRAVELLVALILSKFAIVAVLSLGGAALGHTVFPGAAAALSGTTLIMLAAFSPWALLRLLPLHELASAAAGGLRPHGQLTTADDRAHASTNAAEDGAAELPARMEAERRLPPIDEDSAANRDDGATKGGLPREGTVSAGPEDAAAGVAEVASVSSANASANGNASTNGNATSNGSAGANTAVPPSANGSPPRNGTETAEATHPDDQPTDRAPGMAAPWQAEDHEWRPVTLGREEIDSPRPLVISDDGTDSGEPAAGEDHDPLPPTQDPGEDQP